MGWQAVVKAEKQAKLAAAELLANEDKPARSTKSQRSRAKKLKKLQLGNGDELQDCFDGKISAELHEESGIGCRTCFDDFFTNSTGQPPQLRQAMRHYDCGWHELMDVDASDKPASSNDPKHGMQTKENGVMNRYCFCRPLPLIPAHLVAFDVQVRNTFLHVPLPESSEQPVRKRALSASPRLAPPSLWPNDEP